MRNQTFNSIGLYYGTRDPPPSLAEEGEEEKVSGNGSIGNTHTHTSLHLYLFLPFFSRHLVSVSNLQSRCLMQFLNNDKKKC